MRRKLPMLQLLSETDHFVLPAQNEGYTWKLEQNKKFLEDVINLMEDRTLKLDFGELKFQQTLERDVYTIVDGTQRLICISVLLAVVAAFSEKVVETNDSPRKRIQRLFLANYDCDNIPHLKVVMNDFDAVTYKNILLDKVNYTNHASKPILNLYMYFLGQMAIRKLNPQAVFEALSRIDVTRQLVASTGKLQEIKSFFSEKAVA